MFEMNKIGVYHNINRPSFDGIVKISSIGMESLRFIEPSMLNHVFKKVNVMILVQDGNFVITDDGIVPHTSIKEIDIESVKNKPTSTAIIEAAAIRSARDAGVTISRDSLRLVALAENTEIYYIYTAVVGRKLHDLVEKTGIMSLTRKALMNQCSINDLL